MRVHLLLLTLAVALLLHSTGCTGAGGAVRRGYPDGNVQTIAIAEITGAIWGEGAKNQISDFFVRALLEQGYRAVERRQILNIIAEQELQQADWTTPRNAVELGRIANADALLLINVAQATDDRIELTAKLLDTEDGTIIWAGSAVGRTGRALWAGVGAGVGAAAGWMVAGDEDRGAAAVGGAVLGGLGGAELAPKRATQARKAIGKLARRLPEPTSPPDAAW